MTPPVVVVSVSTSAPVPNPDPTPMVPLGIPVEWAFWNTTTGERGDAIPTHDAATVLRFGDTAWLERIGYQDRIPTTPQDGGTGLVRLRTQLHGALLVGATADFNTEWLANHLFGHLMRPERRPWARCAGTVETYAAGVWGTKLAELPDIADVCRYLGTVPGDHTAAGDVQAAVDALVALGAIKQPPEPVDEHEEGDR